MKKIFSLLAVLGTVLSLSAAEAKLLRIPVGSLSVVDVPFKVENVSISNKDIVRVETLSDRQVRINGLKIGVTDVQLLGSNMSQVYSVTVINDIRETFNALKRDLSDVSEIDLAINNGRIVLRFKIQLEILLISLHLMLVHNRGRKSQYQRPLIIAYTLLERLCAERSVAFNLRKYGVVCMDNILTFGAIANQHFADAGCFDIVIRFIIECEEELATRIGPNFAVVLRYASSCVLLLDIKAHIQLLARMEHLECYLGCIGEILCPIAASNLLGCNTLKNLFEGTPCHINF